MTNEELAVAAQSGDTSALHTLWDQVKPYIEWQARRYLSARSESTAATMDDLTQSGYIGFVNAVETFRDGAACFITHLSYQLKTPFSEATNTRGEKQKRDPLHSAGSLLCQTGGGSGARILDFVPDEELEQALLDVEHNLWLVQLRAALDNAMESLPPNDREVLVQRYYSGKTFARLAAERGVTLRAIQEAERRALRTLRRHRYRQLRPFLVPDYMPHYCSNHATGHFAFSRRGSYVEQEVIRREKRKEIQAHEN